MLCGAEDWGRPSNLHSIRGRSKCQYEPSEGVRQRNRRLIWSARSLHPTLLKGALVLGQAVSSKSHRTGQHLNSAETYWKSSATDMFCEASLQPCTLRIHKRSIQDMQRQLTNCQHHLQALTEALLLSHSVSVHSVVGCHLWFLIDSATSLTND